MTAHNLPVFIVRRAHWFTTVNLALGLLLLALTSVNLVRQTGAGESWVVALLFVVIAGFYCWQGWTQFSDRKPLVEIGRAGLRLPMAAPDPIPWSRLWQVQPAQLIPGLSAGRIDIQVDPETFTRLRLGQRFMGDIVVKRRGAPNSFSILTHGLEHGNNAIMAALRHYWPPGEPTD